MGNVWFGDLEMDMASGGHASNLVVTDINGD